MYYILIAVGVLVCAIQAVRAPRLLVSALWLAGTSALVALAMYLLGAPEVAVVELSVGAGLVTVLFVFAINVAGEETLPSLAAIPKPLSLALVIIAVVMLGLYCLPILTSEWIDSPTLPLYSMFWGNRMADVLMQIFLIFSGVLGVLGLLSEGKSHTKEQGS